MSNTASTTKYTPTPWLPSKRADAIVVNEMHDLYQLPETVKHYGGYVVAESLTDIDRAFVLRACNAHEQLVAALRKIAAADMGEDGCYYTNRANIGIAVAALAAVGA